MYFHQHHHHPKKKRQRLKCQRSDSVDVSKMMPTNSNNRRKVLKSFSSLFPYPCLLVFLLCATVTSGFVIISDQDTPEGWILFDAHVPIQSTSSHAYSPHHHYYRNNQQQEQQQFPNNGFHYQYRISHHKTQPWVHRIVKVDKDGLLQLKKSISNCQYTAGLYPSTFLVYIDIVARYKTPASSTLALEDDDQNGDSEWSGGGHHNHDAPTQRKISRRDLLELEVGDDDDEQNLSSNYDYISFPVTIILKRSNECHTSNNYNHPNDNAKGRENGGGGRSRSDAASLSNMGGWNNFWDKNENVASSSILISSEKGNEINAEIDDQSHVARSVDDIYVSLPMDQDNHCHHSNEKIANVFQFLPASVLAQCGVKAETLSDSAHTFAVQPGTLDVVLVRDWCLFDAYQTVQMVLWLNCTRMGGKGELMHERGLPEKVMAWDQNVHLILHQLGASNPSMDHHPIHRIRREMRNQAPFFDQPLYIAAVPEEQPAGLTVTTIGASDPENQPLTYSMTSLLDARSQQFFSLDSKSGVVTTTSRLDREKMDVHYFRIVATDSGVPPRTGTGTLQVWPVYFYLYSRSWK